MPHYSHYGAYPDGVFFTGSATAPSELVPSMFDVAIAGHTYNIEPKLYKLTHIPLQRPAQDNSNEPGEASLSPEGPWRRSQSDWSLGAGQRWLDEEESVRRRFDTSLGVEVFNDRELTLLHETEQKRSSANTNLKILRVGGRTYIVDGALVKFTTTANQAEQNPSWTTGWTDATGLPGANVLDIAYSGSHVYVLGSDNSIYRATPGTAAFALYYNPTAVATRIWCGLGRLFMADGRSLYEVTATPGETLIFTHPDPNYVMSTLVAAPSGIYFGGNIGTDFAEVRHSWVNDAGTAFVAPVVAAEFINEQIFILRSVGNSITFGTSVGFRYAPIDNLATGLDFGPAVEIGAVRDMVVDTIITPDGRIDTFCWGTWPLINGTANSGLVKIRPTRFTETNVPAYASDIYVSTGGTPISVASINGRRYFAISGVGFYGATQNFVASGTINTGRIRYGTLDQKIFADLKWRTAPLVGTVSAVANYDTGASHSAGTQADSGTVTNQHGPIGNVDAEWASIDFTLTRGGVVSNAMFVPLFATATTPDNAAFAVTDLDVSITLAMDNWSPGGFGGFLIDQWPAVAGNNGWALAIDPSGHINLSWSNDGTATNVQSTSGAPGLAPGSLHTIRATLDVNNGAGGKTIQFFVDGTLFETFTTGGTTAIFNSTGSLGIGTVLPFAGYVTSASLKASIGGAEVANPNFAAQAAGVTSFADAAGRTWTLNSGANIAQIPGSDAQSPTLRWWVIRAIPAAEMTMQIIIPLMLMEKVQGGSRAVTAMAFMEELDFLMNLSQTKQVVKYQEFLRSYDVYINNIEVNPTRINTMDQGLEGIVMVEVFTVTHP